jgi:hypothetical protein
MTEQERHELGELPLHQSSVGCAGAQITVDARGA